MTPGGAMQTSVYNILPENLGQCARFEEKQVGCDGECGGVGGMGV